MTISHVIADLHLCEERPDITEGFLRYLQGVAVEAEQLYILGDFFEAWVGDDYSDATIESVAAALQARAKHGGKTYFCHGNRDFLVGEVFCRKAGMTLLDETTVVDFGGQPTLLMHGDSLCTDDTEYQAFRRMVRDPAWRANFLSQPLDARLAIAAQLRAKSKMASREKAQDIMDVNADAVAAACLEHHVTTLVHGHTHRPADHDQGELRRLVVGDWDVDMYYVRATDDATTLHQWQWR